MTFVRARTAFGGHHVADAPPRMTHVHNAVIYGWAVYDDRRLLVPDSAFTREGVEGGRSGLSFIGSSSTINLNPYARRPLPDDDYVWIGHIHDHFGHFLVSTLSRLWSISHHSPTAKLVTTCPGDLDRRLKIPFIAAIMKALGLTEDRFVQVGDYTTIQSIAVPEALLVENSSINRSMSEFCIRIADRIIAADETDTVEHNDLSATERPLFLTKRLVHHGVRTIRNEDDFAAQLEQQGVLVVSPETLTFADQLRLWRRHRLIGAFEGSSLHTAIFNRQKKLLSVSTNSSASSNQVLINAAAGHQSLYLSSNGALEEASPGPGFQVGSRFVDPAAAAQSYLRAAAYLAKSSEHMRMRSMLDTVSPWVFVDEPFGSNISRGKPARMSSVDPNWGTFLGDTAQEAAGAVNGKLSGRYQFHSKPETSPWWQVDLGGPCLVTEVRVFNRNDVAQSRARNIILSCSSDSIEWTELTRRSDEKDFGGGPAPQPWRWWQDVPFEARFIRLHLEAETLEFFHLDQVEVFGFALDHSMPLSF